MDEKSALSLFEALGINAKIGDETYQALLDHHPTVRAFVDGDISFAEAIFVEEYLSNGFNASKAAKSAKYAAYSAGGFSGIGSSVLKRPKIKMLVARRIAERALSSDEILARYREVSEASLEDFVESEGDEIYASLAKALNSGKIHLAKELKVNKDGEVSIKLRDADHALDQLARSAGVFEKDNTIKLPPEVLALLNLNPNELAGRDNAYDAMDEWEKDADAGDPPGDGEREDSEPDSATS
jgi:phage terminase small subunit